MTTQFTKSTGERSVDMVGIDESCKRFNAGLVRFVGINRKDRRSTTGVINFMPTGKLLPPYIFQSNCLGSFPGWTVLMRSLTGSSINWRVSATGDTLFAFFKRIPLTVLLLKKTDTVTSRLPTGPRKAGWE